MPAPALASNDAYVLGGANSAGQAALHIAEYARRVTMVVRRESLDAGMSKIKAAYPKGQTTQYGAVVILATGPKAAEYMADVKKSLPAPG